LLRDTVWNHPVIVASSAASVGVLLGAFVAVQLLAPPPHADSAAAPQAALASKGETQPAPETTGSAPTSDRTASADCERETWPYLSRPCMEKMQSRYRTRVISTDKLDQPTINAIQASPPTPPESKPAAPAVADTAPVSPSPSLVDLAAAPSAVFAAPDASAAALASAAPPSQPAGNVEAKKEKRVATKSKRKPKAEPKAPAKQESDDDDDTSVASNDSDDRASGERSDRRLDRRRIVERWIERDYDVPASNGDGQRRVTVIRRSGGGMFEGLFGN